MSEPGHWILKPLTPHAYNGGGRPKDSGGRDTVKGMVPGHVCIVQVCFTQGFQEDRNQTRA